MKADTVKYINATNVRTTSITENTLVVNYGEYLTSLNIGFIEEAPYHYIDRSTGSYDWALNLSVLTTQLEELLIVLLPHLESKGLSYKIPISSDYHDQLINGNYGYQQIAKAVIIYPETDLQALELAQHLTGLTAMFDGAEIPDAFYLGGCLYASLVEGPSKVDQKASWPFNAITKIPLKKPVKLINKRYLITNSIKNDAKGNVYKAFDLKKWLNIKWCLIKEGKRHQCRDEFGRSIANRLAWQFQVQEMLSDKIPTPKPIDLFDFDGNTYLAMQFIEGESFHHVISAIQEGIIWHRLTREKQAELTNMLMELTDLVGAFHENGFLHRDLNPLNFMIDHHHKLFAIDIELSYHFERNEPFPAFTLGTDGYMSPNQRNGGQPCIEDDIYGLGSLLIRTFTGISPAKFQGLSEEKLFDNLNFFINSRRITSLLCSCWTNDPVKRPTVIAIKHNLALYHSLIVTAQQKETIKEIPLSQSLSTVITQSLATLTTAMFCSPKGTWLSDTIDHDLRINNVSSHQTWYPGFQVGASGLLYLITVSDQLGYDLGTFRPGFYQNFEQVKQEFEKTSVPPNAGLNSGAAGFAVVVATMIRCGLLENSLQNMDLISRSLTVPTHFLSIADGLAGIGMAMMRCSELLNFPNFTLCLEELAARLIKLQNSDGSWTIQKEESDPKGLKVTGLFNGTAGIAYFLMTYGQRFYQPAATGSARKGLKWLTYTCRTDNGTMSWPLNSKNKYVDPWLENGFTGIAYVYLKAYEIFHDEAYKLLAVGALNNHPGHITSNYLSQAQGISGLGEVYLEAFRILKQDEWLQRAEHIVHFLLHCYREGEPNEIFWIEGSDVAPKADFGTGNAGILHFLMRYENPHQIQFPLLSLTR